MNPNRFTPLVLCLALLPTWPAEAAETRYFDVPAGDHPHDVAPAPDGTVWYTGQHKGVLGRLDPGTGRVERVPLGEGSRPHGVIVGPDGAAWVTDSGLNAIVRVDPASKGVKVFPLPKAGTNANLNTAAFDGEGRLWFTGQTGIYGRRLDPKTGEIDVVECTEGHGALRHHRDAKRRDLLRLPRRQLLGKPDLATGETQVIEPKGEGVGTRRVWSDSRGRLWVSEWKAGNLSVYDPAAKDWTVYKLPGAEPQAYSVYVDKNDKVWVSDFAANAILRFDPESQTFASFPSDKEGAAVRQMLERKGEVWGAESGTDRLVVIRHGDAAAGATH